MKTLPAEGFEKSLPVQLAPLCHKSGLPVVFCVAAGELYDKYAAVALEAGLPVFRAAVRAARALSTFVKPG